MILKWIKSKKGTDVYKYLIFVIVLFSIYFGILIYENVSEKIIDNSTSTSESESSQNDDKENKEEDLFEDVHIGWSNVIVFSGLAIALYIVRRKNGKAVEKQREINYGNEDSADETNNN